MQKDLVALKTRISWTSFGYYGKNIDKLSDKKKEKQRSETFVEEAITSLGNHYF
jgi:hypothetical protein